MYGCLVFINSVGCFHFFGSCVCFCAGRLITLWVFDVGCGLLDLICGCASCALVGLFALFVVPLIWAWCGRLDVAGGGLGFVAWFCGLLVGVSVCFNVVCCVL